MVNPMFLDGKTYILDSRFSYTVIMAACNPTTIYYSLIRFCNLCAIL